MNILVRQGTVGDFGQSLDLLCRAKLLNKKLRLGHLI